LIGITVRVLRYVGDAPRLVAVASKVSVSRKPFEAIEAMGDGEVETWVKETFRRQHFSPWEHASYTFLVDGLSRVASHQLVRHRVASYTQMSHRYTEGYLRMLGNEASVYFEFGCLDLLEGNKREGYRCYADAVRLYLSEGTDVVRLASIAFVPPLPLLHRRGELEVWARQVLGSVVAYYTLLSRGVLAEDARYVLPDSVRTRVVVTMNARELIQVFLSLRMCSRAQWEIRLIAWMLWRELVKIHPQLFKWAGPSCVFRENTSRWEPRPLEDYLEGKEGFSIDRCPELVEKKAIPGCLRYAMSVLEKAFESVES